MYDMGVCPDYSLYCICRTQEGNPVGHTDMQENGIILEVKSH